MKKVFAIAAVSVISLTAFSANAGVSASVIEKIHAKQAENRAAIMEYVASKNKAAVPARLQDVLKNIHAKQAANRALIKKQISARNTDMRYVLAKVHAKQAANRVAIMEEIKLQEAGRSQLSERN
ncbi:MAG: hypothetical protein OEY84_06515 [Rhodospirillaceae bacterium]|nr:hypothetical protein [Rhodospirillaceae bacterium]